MPLDNPQASTGYAAEFQSAGLPWVTSSIVPAGSVQHWAFGKVTRAITVRNNNTGSAGAGDYLAIGFTQNGVQGSNRFLLPPNQTEMFEVRVKDLYVSAISGSCEYSVLAALTTVDPKFMPTLTGSLWDGVG